MNSTSKSEQTANSWVDQYRAALGQLASRRMVEEVQRGGWVGRIPLGYIAGRDGSKRIEVDPEKAELIRTAFGLKVERCAWVASRFQSSLWRCRQHCARAVGIRPVQGAAVENVSSIHVFS